MPTCQGVTQGVRAVWHHITWNHAELYLILNKRPRCLTFTPLLPLGGAGRLSHAAPRSQFSLLSTGLRVCFCVDMFPMSVKPVTRSAFTSPH